MGSIRYAVYILNPRRGYATIATAPSSDRKTAETSEAAKRNGAYIIAGSDFPARIAQDEILWRAKHSANL